MLKQWPPPSSYCTSSCLPAPDHSAFGFPLKEQYIKEWEPSPGCHTERPAQAGLHVYRHLVQEFSTGEKQLARNRLGHEAFVPIVPSTSPFVS